MEAESKWGKICSEDGKGSKAKISAKRKGLKKMGKLYKKGREKPHSRDKCPHHGLEDCITALQHASRP